MDLVPQMGSSTIAAINMLDMDGRFDATALESARSLFEGKREAFLAALGESTVDEPGAENIAAHIDGFYVALERFDELVQALP